ncbi:hypothetical protein [Rhizobium oryzicola]|uniref:Glycosyl transferase n=1 Tax=Rhizobium oryzicola TaxID=1232668 RepID=A0ABT8T3Q3_9HYPH|nr:hypothetical protein [Rhizobium oryzicola]MDO1584783.1 hypothetical protein [Rhizobium oryzicola]
MVRPLPLAKPFQPSAGPMLVNLIILIAAAGVSAFCISLLIRKSRELGLVQDPVARSSHTRPTPTGGGTGIVIGATLAGLVLPGLELDGCAVLALGILIAVVGLIDDWRPLSAKVRLIVQAAVVAGAIILADATTILVPDGGLFGIVAAVLLLLGGLWWVNLFNFMDGIDGIAGQQAVFMLLSALVISVLRDAEASQTWIWWMMAAVTASTLAFLAFNWPPARIFMGDAGSTFLGFTIVMAAFMSMQTDWMTLPQWLLLASIFACDATITLMVRFLRKQRLSEAHRSHAYQRLSRRFGGARPVSTSIACLNLFILFPLAAVMPDSVWAWAIVICVYGVISAAVLWAGAGLPDTENAHWQAYRRLLR